MNRFLGRFQHRKRTAAAATFAAVAGFATATLFGVAFAASFTVQVARNAQVTNQAGVTSRENFVATPRGFAVYELMGDSATHPKCTKGNGCFSIWPPVKVSSAKNLSKAPGITGKLHVWRRDGFLQLTLGGHPLYRFALDNQRDHATGQGINSFGGTWHVIKVAGSASGGTPGGTTTMTTTTMTTTTMTTTTTTGTTTCLYPGYC